ncbi:nitrate- and nitrite sensing domain-containing protein [Streptomyces marincola]|uniref:nitrate- and nitrite sensing domain-containing protein n=1 Tax=Streptomyces marincola TaxID=2878388 RepID=UPI001CF47DEE|nr:nitrate- and nitrite sensing domain-containing protein [Streptomyces marincola]UCM86708.1 nitrate- and nitrite sensing domain-containing protein [Streptomyces marincola]
MRFRGKSIRRKIGALTLVPLLSLVSVWAFATAITVPEAREVTAARDAAEALAGPAEDVTLSLQRERRQTLVHVADPRRADALSRLTETQDATDAAVDRLRQRAEDVGDDLSEVAGDRLDTLLATLDGVEQLRDQVRNSTLSRPGALDGYGRLADPLHGLLAVLQPVDDTDLSRQARAVVGLAEARELLSRADALIAGALAAGQIAPDELRALGDLIAQRNLVHETYLPDLPLEDRQAHASFWESGTGGLLTSTEESVLDGRLAVVRAGQWEQIGGDAQEQLGTLLAEARDRYGARLDPDVDSVLVRAALAGLGLLAVVASATIALRAGRGLARDLRTLSRQAGDAAELRLPGVKRRLAAGEHVDVETEAPRLDYGDDELGRVGRALNTLQREAVSATVERVRTRRGVSEVFVNLARRHQVLLHRQLNLLDGLERRTAGSEDLADLHRLGHLAARMRRHAEGLVILSGAAPARQWRKPEQLMDVIRAAVDEVEDYERVEIHRLPSFTVAGGAVADLVHLVAELLENATVFSPPHTAVQVTGERVPHGFTIEIHDRGLGMTADALREANEQLASVPDFELSGTDRLGLHVVSRLAERHGIRVSLRESPYGGTTAVTLIPGELLTETADEPEERDPLPYAPGRPALLDGPVDGPVELEAPVGPADGMGAAEDAFTGQPHVRSADETDGLRPGWDPGGGSTWGPAHERDHERARERTGEQTRDQGHGAGHPPPAPRPPRREGAPVLISDHGRTVAGPPEERRAPRATTTGSGLPRRVRRAGPAGPAAGGGDRPVPGEPGDAPGAPGTGGGDAVPDLDAEEVRTRMAALQRGWRRGRQESDPGRGQAPPEPEV